MAQLRDWHALASEEAALEPDLPIVDAHHHLYGALSDAQHYRVEDLVQDLHTGHRVLGSVYVEAFQSAWHADGEPALRSVGEVEMVVHASRRPVQTASGPCQWAAGIVSNVDLMLGDALERLLQAHVSAGQGCLRGVRHHATRDDGVVGQFIHSAPRYLLADPTFRHGLACLARFDLAFDVVVFHTQLDKVADLLDACPRNRFVLNHVGLPIGVGEYETHRAAVFAEWRLKMHALAQRPNLDVKIGGMGMPIFGFGFENARRPARSDELARAWQPTIDVCVQAFGPQRCMFESNFPMDKQACGYAALWNAFKLCTRGMSTDERAALFYRTACRTYRLPELERLVA